MNKRLKKKMDKKEQIRTYNVNGAILKNYTPHSINIGEVIIPPSGIIARLTEKTIKLGNINNIPISKLEYCKDSNLPEEQENVFYIVSLPVIQALKHRKDLLICGNQIRNDKGQIIGCSCLATL